MKIYLPEYTSTGWNVLEIDTKLARFGAMLYQPHIFYGGKSIIADLIFTNPAACMDWCNNKYNIHDTISFREVTGWA